MYAPGTIIACRRNRKVYAGTGREVSIAAGIIMYGKSQLFEMVFTLGAAGGFPGLLDGGSNRAIRMAMMAITTSNSIRVKPRLVRIL